MWFPVALRCTDSFRAFSAQSDSSDKRLPQQPCLSLMLRVRAAVPWRTWQCEAPSLVKGTLVLSTSILTTLIGSSQKNYSASHAQVFALSKGHLGIIRNLLMWMMWALDWKEIHRKGSHGMYQPWGTVLDSASAYHNLPEVPEQISWHIFLSNLQKLRSSAPNQSKGRSWGCSLDFRAQKGCLPKQVVLLGLTQT